jgi:hypothetical protein
VFLWRYGRESVDYLVAYKAVTVVIQCFKVLPDQRRSSLEPATNLAPPCLYLYSNACAVCWTLPCSMGGQVG